MKKLLLCICMLLFNGILIMPYAGLYARGKDTSGMSEKICVPVSFDSVIVLPQDSIAMLPREIMGNVTFSLSNSIAGRLRVNHSRIQKENLKVYFSKIVPLEDSDSIGEKQMEGMCRRQPESFELIPIEDKAGKRLTFNVYTLPTPGRWTLTVPEGYFLIDPDYKEVDEIDIEEKKMHSLSVAGAWHKPGKKMNLQPMFTIHDDDGIDGMVPSSKPSPYMKWGYFSMLYPVLESLGLRGCVSMEGRRCGFTQTPPSLSDNGLIAKRLQDERRWEIQSHSMLCPGEKLNCWAVDNLECDLAREIMKNGDNYGLNDLNTVSVYDRTTRRQYMPDAERINWVEVPSRMIKPYVGDYTTKQPIFFDEAFDVDYHWGEWFRLAEKFGFNGKTWVAYNSSSSHALAPRINSICPNGFADAGFMVNKPPLLSTAARCLLEGQTIKGYKGEMDSDNSYNNKHMAVFKKAVDDAAASGGWITFAMHAYRKCWDNYRKGALVSEGGSYPDEWVMPLQGIDPLNDPLTPPARLGISHWSEWYPCPGTRLRMMWDLLRYAKEKGLVNVTSSEGFEKIGNREVEGYFTNGISIGQDNLGIEGSSGRHPHYVEAVTGEVFYYNPLENPEISLEFDIADYGDDSLAKAFSLDGIVREIRTLGDLPQGIWVVNGFKIFVRK